MKWEQFERMNRYAPEYANKILTNIECPKCGKKLYQRTDIVLTSDPPQYQYECSKCGFIGHSLVQYAKNTCEWKNGHCSCCGEDISSMLDTWTDVQNFLFCPNCGAKVEKWVERNEFF